MSLLPDRIAKQALLSPLYNLLHETDLQLASNLSTRLNRRILLKREDQHPVFSFKARGASHKLLKMSPKKRANGVVAASAGNHAQGVAFAARACKVPAHIFMPSTTQQIKIDAVESFGAKVYLDQDDLTATIEDAIKFANKRKLPFVHPFDDEDIITGQSTVGLELLHQIDEDTEAVFVCCGGGGLLAGIATIIKQYRPKVKVIGVEPEDAMTMTSALKAGKIVTLPYVGNFAETVAVKRAGKKTFELCKQFVDQMIVVDSGQICNAIKAIYENTRVIVEPAGALGVAGILEYVKKNKGTKSLVGVISGANMNFDALRYVIERTRTGVNTEMLLAAVIPDKPGSFLNLCKLLGKRHVTEFSYRYAKDSVANIFAGIELKDESERAQILAHLNGNGIKTIDLTGDETAELHVRHMIGGRALSTSGEQIYNIEFPERHNALVHFLTALKSRWNISLFHYRFHGANIGRVMIGLQASDAERPKLEKVLKKIGYVFTHLENNVAYNMFLATPNGK